MRNRSLTRGFSRLLAVLLALSLVAAACGDDDDTTADSTADSTADTGGDGSETPAADDDTGDAADDAAGDDTADGTETPAADDSGDTTEPAGDPEPTNGFDGETIKLGYLTDQSGALSIVGNPLLAGAQAYWDYVNDELGGVAGRYKVELVTGDTKDDEAATVQEYQRIREDVVMVAEVLSTPPTQAVLEFLEEDGIIAVPGSLAAQWNKEANLLPNGAAYEFEMINLADWFVNESGLGSADSVACVVYVNDIYGENTLRGLEHAAAELGFEIAVSETIGRGDTDFTAQITALNDGGCEVVYAITLPSEQNAMLAAANSQGFEPVWLGALPSYINLLAAGNQDLYTNMYVALDTPSFLDTDVPGMVDFLDRWGAYGSGDPNTFHLSGYFQSIAVHALLEKAVSMGDLSHEGLQAALADLGEVELDGLADNYVYGTPENREPASASRIFHFDPEGGPNLMTQVAQVDSALIESFEY
ncbi:MAG: ABC transporter substrate-binding protein [Acidimicrobiales bacterium]|nr:ABC transporter substrate-binding protein [Acidimicrobiales bacterium]